MTGVAVAFSPPPTAQMRTFVVTYHCCLLRMHRRNFFEACPRRTLSCLLGRCSCSHLLIAVRLDSTSVCNGVFSVMKASEILHRSLCSIAVVVHTFVDDSRIQLHRHRCADDLAQEPGRISSICFSIWRVLRFCRHVVLVFCQYRDVLLSKVKAFGGRQASATSKSRENIFLNFLE